MTTHATISGPGELLASIPEFLGFEPRESAVIVGIRPPGELGVIMRVDRVDCLVPEVAAPLARAVAAHLARDGASAAFVVSYTTADVRLACEAADALRPALQGAVDRVDTWAVAHGRYFSPGCADLSCCPPGGSPLPPARGDLGASARLRDVGHVVHGQAPAPVKPEDKRKAARAADRWTARRERGVDAWRRESWQRWQRALDRACRGDLNLEPVEAGKIVSGLQDKRVRDAAVLSLVPGGEAAALGALDGTGDHLVAEALDAVLSARIGTRISPEVADGATVLCASLMAVARTRARAPMQTLAGIVAWWEGDVLVADELCAGALESEPGYRLAELMAVTVRSGLEPGWLRANTTNAPGTG